MLGIPCLTAVDTADALADSLMSRYSEINTELVDINNMREKRKKIDFIKMQGAGNDYIYIDCLEKWCLHRSHYRYSCPTGISVSAVTALCLLRLQGG